MAHQTVHPGHILKTSYIDPGQISVKDLAKQLGISSQKLKMSTTGLIIEKD